MSKRAAIAIGSNLSDRLQNLQTARDRIRALPGVTLPMVQSAIYETSAINCETGAQNFYNAVIEIGFEESADELLQALQQIERLMGRERSSPSPDSSSQVTPMPPLPVGAGLAQTRASRPAEEKAKGEREAAGDGIRKTNLSRTIDLDLLYFGSEERTGQPLQLPHPRMTERRFVLQPLCDIAPDLRLPGQTKNVGELLAELPEQGRIMRLMEDW